MSEKCKTCNYMKCSYPWHWGLYSLNPPPEKYCKNYKPNYQTIEFQLFTKDDEIRELREALFNIHSRCDYLLNRSVVTNEKDSYGIKDYLFVHLNAIFNFAKEALFNPTPADEEKEIFKKTIIEGE